jgi:hypothetical protein
MKISISRILKYCELEFQISIKIYVNNLCFHNYRRYISVLIMCGRMSTRHFFISGESRRIEETKLSWFMFVFWYLGRLWLICQLLILVQTSLFQNSIKLFSANLFVSFLVEAYYKSTNIETSRYQIDLHSMSNRDQTQIAGHSRLKYTVSHYLNNLNNIVNFI